MNSSQTVQDKIIKIRAKKINQKAEHLGNIYSLVPTQ